MGKFNLRQSPSVRKWASAFVDILFFLAGSLLYAASVNIFTAPNNIAPGGFTGIATMLNYLFGLPIGSTILVMNLPFFFIGAWQLGKGFLAKVIAGTVLSSVVIDITAPFMPAYQGDMAGEAARQVGQAAEDKEQDDKHKEEEHHTQEGEEHGLEEVFCQRLGDGGGVGVD